MTKSTKAEINAMSLNDLLGAPIPFGKAPKVTKGPRILLTEAEKKAKRNEAQKALRSTPEGRAYANAASKKSIALKKAKVQAELEALRAMVAAIAAEPEPEEVQQDEEQQQEVKVAKKSSKASPKKSSSKKTSEEASL